jgi:hypothetical protein
MIMVWTMRPNSGVNAGVKSRINGVMSVSAGIPRQKDREKAGSVLPAIIANGSTTPWMRINLG